MGALTLTLCDMAGNPLVADGPLLGSTGATVTMEQLDLFEGHQVTVSGEFRRNLMAIAPWTTVKISEAGVGIVGWGVITSPETQISDQGNKIVLNLANISEQLHLSDTGQGWVASTGIGTVVSRLGSLRPGWSATFADVGAAYPNIVTSAPVQWTSLVGVTAIANTLTKTATTGAYDAGGVSQQVAASGNCAATFVVLSLVTGLICGLDRTPTFPTATTIDYGISVLSGQMYTVENGVTVGPIAAVVVGDILRVGVEGALVKYYKNGILVRTSGVAPVFPFYVVGLILTPNAQLGGVTFTRNTPPSEAWVAIRFEQSPLLGAFIDLAKATFHHVRLAKRITNGSDATGPYLAGDPYRAIEFGTFGAPATLRLVSATGGSVRAINTNPDVRIITAFSRKRDAMNVINSIAPLGGGTGDTQVDLERCWRIVNDPTYPGYGKYGQVDGSIFPEYNPLYPLPGILYQGTVVPARLNRAGTGMEPAATLDGKYEYRVTDPASITYWKGIFDPTGTNGETGEMRGSMVDSAYSYTDQTPGNQEVTARGLYVAAITRLYYSSLTNETISVTTTGAGRVSRAGDLVHVAYNRTGTDKDGIYIQVAVDQDYTVLGVKRSYDDNGPIRDEWVLSDRPFRANDQQTAAADARRAMTALQLVPTTGLATLSVSGGGDCDVTHPYDKTVPMPPELFRVRSAPLFVDFKPVRRTVTVAADKTHQHSYTIPSLVVRVTVGGTASINTWTGVVVTVNSLSGSASINSWTGVNASIASWQGVTASIFNWTGATVTINNWTGASLNGSASVSDWRGVAAYSDPDYAKTFLVPDVPGHNNQATHGTNMNVGSHGHVIIGTTVWIDPKAAGVVKYGSAGTSPATTYVTDVTAAVYGDHTHGAGAGGQRGGNGATNTSGADGISISGMQASANIGQFATANGGFKIEGTATGHINGAVTGTATGTITGTVTLGASSFSGNPPVQISGSPNSMPITGTGSGTITGTGSGTITGTGSGTANASGVGSTDLQLHTIGPDGGHFHDLTWGIVDNNTSMRIQLWIDSGDGQYVDRSPALGGPWTSAFSVPDISPYVQSPGRKVRLRCQPQSLTGQLDGLGSVELFGTWTIELGGVSSVVYAQ